jgi:HNH endonuclease/NUMOD4 motif
MRWVRVTGYEDYEISESGQIRRWRNLRRNYMVGRVLKPKLSVHGYLVVSLFSEGKYYHVGVHRLVCMAFNGVPANDNLQVCHSDGNKLNNDPQNLRWGTAKENADDRAKHGQWDCQKGSEHHQAVLDEAMVAEMRRMARSGRSIKSIAAHFGQHKVTTRSAIRGITWKHVSEPPHQGRKNGNR